MIATKVSHHPDYKGLAPATIRAGIEASLKRLGVNVIDLYYAHFDDPRHATRGEHRSPVGAGGRGQGAVPGALQLLSRNAWRNGRGSPGAGGFHRPIALQQMYSLVERGVEQSTLPIAQEQGWAFLPYYALACGFLTGKYTSEQRVDSPRAGTASAYLTDKGRRIIAAMEEVSEAHGVAVASVALAWVAARPGVGAVLASARTPEQLEALIEYTTLTLTEDQMARTGRGLAIALRQGSRQLAGG